MTLIDCTINESMFSQLIGSSCRDMQTKRLSVFDVKKQILTDINFDTSAFDKEQIEPCDTGFHGTEIKYLNLNKNYNNN